MPVTAADLLNERGRPFFAQPKIPLTRVRSDRRTEYGGVPARQEYARDLAVENIDHTQTKTWHSQTNGICERFHMTMLNAFYRGTFRKQIYRTLEELQVDLDE